MSDVWPAELLRMIAEAIGVPPDEAVVLAAVKRLRQIEKAARRFAAAAMDPEVPPEVGPQVVEDLLEAFGALPPERLTR